MSMPHVVRLFILRTNLMKKAIIQVGYTQYVMDTQKAITLLELLSEAEVYESKWDSRHATHTHYIYPQPEDNVMSELKLIPIVFYQIAKMAGNPVKEGCDE